MQAIFQKFIFYYNEGIETANIEGEKLNYNGKSLLICYVVINKDGKIGLAIHDGTYCAQKLL